MMSGMPIGPELVLYVGKEASMVSMCTAMYSHSVANFFVLHFNLTSLLK